MKRAKEGDTERERVTNNKQYAKQCDIVTKPQVIAKRQMFICVCTQMAGILRSKWIPNIGQRMRSQHGGT